MHISVSIVSHGHDVQVRALLAQLAALRGVRPDRVLLTLNLPEPALAQAVRARRWPFPLTLIENTAPASFAANHNRAFAAGRCGASADGLFAVLNPDITLQANPLACAAALLERDPRAGAVYTEQRDARGRLQDFRRRVPLPGVLLRRYVVRALGGVLGRQREELPRGARPDWVNAAFLCIRSATYAQLGGFDERYPMYCEDVDFCLRLQLAGWHLEQAAGASVIHAGARSSHRHPRYLWWHVRSLTRLWRSRACRDFLAQRRSHPEP